MNKADKAALRNRWPSDLEFGLNRALKKEDWRDKNTANARWREQPFGVTAEGKLDYRGFPLRESLNYHYLAGIDFSALRALSGKADDYGLSRGDGIVFSRLEDCVFIEAEMPGFLDERCVRCDFSAAQFKGTQMNGTFEACRFVKAKLKQVIGELTFIDCDFTDADLTGSVFDKTRFERCTFANTRFNRCDISRSRFIDSPLSQAQIDSCSSSAGVRFD